MAIAPGGQAKFVEGNLFRHITVMSLTSSVGLMAIFAVDLINMLFISMLGRSELAAAVGYGGAIMFFVTSFGIGMSIAAGALVARALGMRDPAEAKGKATHALILGVIFAVAFSAVVWLMLDVLVGLLGATGETRALAVHYLQIIVPSMPFLMVGMVGGAILRSHGDARRAMAATLWGAAVNAVLDPILIFGFGLELTGAAVATVVARMVIAAVALLPIIRHHGGFVRPSVTGILTDARPVAAIALPAILTQMATPVGQAWVTRAMSEYGEAAVAGMAIAGRVTPVAFGVIFALSGAVGPIIGQNAGAGRFDRVRRAYLDGVMFTALVIVLVSALLFVLRGTIADAFAAEGLTRDLVYLFCGPLSLLWFFNGLIFVSNAAFNNLGTPLHSTWTNWGRQTIGTVPFVMIGSVWFGATGVLFGQAIGGVLFGLAAVWLALRVIARRTPSEGSGRQSLPDGRPPSRG
ncbi:MAG: MATE family efflux transporter [Gemmobacter sp.]|nr:MATE family efflux transporter [Gemmobacter sp.]